MYRYTVAIGLGILMVGAIVAYLVTAPGASDRLNQHLPGFAL
jgi:hypothetical protein